MAADHADGEGVPAFLSPCGYAFAPVAHVRAAFKYIKTQYSGQAPRPYAAGGILPAAREFVCKHCEHGQCARCNDLACTCCYGNEE